LGVTWVKNVGMLFLKRTDDETKAIRAHKVYKLSNNSENGRL
jgi:hypothetical protein